MVLWPRLLKLILQFEKLREKAIRVLFLDCSASAQVSVVIGDFKTCTLVHLSTPLFGLITDLQCMEPQFKRVFNISKMDYREANGDVKLQK